MRNKTKKMRGRKTHGYGARKKHRGKGSRGGKGMAGSGKRADHKKMMITKLYGTSYFGKKGFVRPVKKYVQAINLDQMHEIISLLTSSKLARETNEGMEIDLGAAGYTKLLGRGDVKEKLIVKVPECSKQAEEKIKKAGGKVIKPIFVDVKSDKSAKKSSDVESEDDEEEQENEESEEDE